jgi:hypothetical protein
MRARVHVVLSALAVAACVQTPASSFVWSSGPPDGGGSCLTDTELCANAGKNCGMTLLTDACGRSRSAQCGTCTGLATCGGAGVPNVCGGCSISCPQGFSCSGGACVGGSAQNLVLNLVTHTVSGSIKLDGQTPLAGASCSGNPTATMANVSFASRLGTTSRVRIPCGATGFTFSAQLPADTYTVTVADDGATYSNLPTGTFVVNPALAVTGPQSNLGLDLRTVPVSGVIQLNGQTPQVGPSCSGNPTATMANAWFYSDTGSVARAPIPCSATTFSFSTRLPTGTWRAVVSDDGSTYSNLPTGSFVVNPNLAISASTTGVTLNLVACDVSGSIQVNGQTPLPGPSCSGSPTATMANVLFVGDTGSTARVAIPCSASNFTWATKLQAGTWKVSVSDDGATYSNLPPGAFVVRPALQVSGPTTNLSLALSVVNLSGAVRLDNQTPSVGASCSGSPTATMANVYFSSDSGSLARVRIPCSATNFDFSTQLPPDTWHVLIADDGATYSNLPTGTFEVKPPLQVAAAASGLTFNLATVAVAGRVELNGQSPVVGASCNGNPTATMANVYFLEPGAKPITSVLAALSARPSTSARVRIPCSATNFSFSARLPSGNYRAFVADDGDTYSNLPTGTSAVVDTIRLQ